MSAVVTTEVIGHIGLIALNNPPVNAASAALRAGLVEGLEELVAAPQVQAIAIYGDGRSFIAGADIREFGKPSVDPTLPEVCKRIENAPKPVVAILHGVALGGGLEVAISAHARVAIPGIQLGFPEVGLGIIPGAGGTQRAPRLTGMAAALDLIISTRRIGADEALTLGLVDQVAEGEPRELAISMAAAAISGELRTRRTSEITVLPDDAALEAARAKLAKTQPHLFSPHKAVEAVAASTGDLYAGLAQERSLFQDCIESPQRKGLIHAFFAERAVAKQPNAELRDITKIGVLGAGTMGSGIATACLLAGFPVVLVEQNGEALDRGAGVIGKNLDGAVKRGKMTADARDAVALTPSTETAALSDCDLIIEAVYEDMDVKKSVLKVMEAASPNALYATNTSYLDINEMAGALDAPERLIGLHFFSPAHVMRLLEVVVGDRTSPEVVATAFAFAKRVRKVAVRSGVGEGFIGNRIMSAYRQAADFMLLDGASVTQIDTAVRDFGFAMGPFETADLAGLDIGWATRKRLAPTRDPAARYHGALGDALCEAGHFGRKTGRGYYDHSGERPVENPDVAAMLDEIRARDGITACEHSAEEIAARYTTAMIAEAARVLDDGIAQRPVDIDAVFLFGYGFPRWRGGPMFYADTIGAPALVDRIGNFVKDDPHFWHVPKTLAAMAESNTSFADLNERG